MKVHEYQARELLVDAGVPVPDSSVVETVDQAVSAFEKIGGRSVVKAQVFAGGRGKAGFVKLCDSADEVRESATFMLSNRMVSPQTGAEGIAVKKLLVAAAVDIESEYYVAVVMDRGRRCPVVMVSREGGVEIEVVAKKNPDAIFKQWLHPHLGLLNFQCAQLVRALGFTDKAQAKAAAKVIRGLVDVFYEYDCALAEINPLVRTTGGEVLAIDAKMNFDDNATFRHKRLQEMFDPAEENPMELRAKEHDLSYIPLYGNIGCVVNGAGLAMSTMDLIKLHGGEPANFLDVGGGAGVEQVTEAFRIILADDNVKAVLVNIFGGIMRCDTIVEALLEAYDNLGFSIPLVVRLEGTNVEIARKMIGESGRNIGTATDLTDAAKKVVGTLTP
ncbi:MAG: ADP-forming succinate--CoA ligase subunit beta [Planctomycetes bacterium]|nr:ADP-forming succinate--CoA ligase subunit beta [Planctomycetota bacterium]